MTTPSRMFLCGRNMGDLCTISSNLAAVTDFPASNMQRQSRARTFRVRTGGGMVQLQLTFGAGLSERLNFVDLGRHNLSTSAQWEIYAYTSYDYTGSPLFVTSLVDCYDSATLGELDFGIRPLGSSVFDGFLGQKRSTYYFMENTTAVNSMLINIYDELNPDGYLEIGRIFTGRGVELAYNPSTENMRWAEQTDKKRSEGATLMRDGSVSYRIIGAELDVVDADDRAELADTMRVAGLREDVFISLYPGAGGELERDYTMVGGFTTLPDLQFAFYNHWKTKGEWEES